LNTLKGVYALFIELGKTVIIDVGALGKMEFRKGLYVYVGSAQNNLEQRLRRHLRKEKRLFWHVDYLLRSEDAKVAKVLYKQANRPEECEIAKELAERSEPINGFGCSDCTCRSHLFRLKEYKFLLESMQVLNVET
jgi:Uri superfamily endonuclease